MTGLSGEIVNQVVPLAACRPHPQNYQRHAPEQIADLRKSLRKFRQVRSIVVQDDGAGGFFLVAGHGLAEAARAEGLTELRADVIPADWPPVKVLAYLAADNELARRADPDQAQLAALVTQVQIADAELAQLAAGGDAALKRLLALVAASARDDPGPQLDNAAELQEKWQVKPGDCWQLGEHRLICGDCTDAAVVARVMGGERAVLLCTDPPYGVDFEGAKYNPHAKAWAGIEGDKRQGNDLIAWLTDCLSLWLSFCDEDLAIYLWTAAMQEGAAAAAAAAAAGIHIQSQIIWNKNSLVLGQADYQWKHENCWYGFRQGKHHRWFGGRSQTTVWDVSRIANSAYLHPMQKPVDLYERAIENHTRPDEICAEPFSGSGTQIIACERLGRRCRACEIEPKYVAVTLERWSQMTGQLPVLLTREPVGAGQPLGAD